MAVWQLKELGLGRGAIEKRVANGRLHRLHRGVYAVGHSRVTRKGKLTAAVLACGPGAVLSHRSAAELWGIRGTAGRAEVTAVGRQGHPGIRVHRVRRLHPEDYTVHDGIPVTTVARTLLDCAQGLGPRKLRNTIEDTERMRLFDLRAIDDCCLRSHGHRGVKPLRAGLAQVHGEPPDVRSPLERRFLDFCAEAALPEPATNATVCGHVVDAVWLDKKLVVELDGFAFHRTRAAFEADRIRDAALQGEGFRVLRITHRRLTTELPELQAAVRGFLAL